MTVPCLIDAANRSTASNVQRYFNIQIAIVHGLQHRIVMHDYLHIQLCILQMGDTWSKTKTQQMHECGKILAKTGRIGGMLFEPQIRFVVEQAIEHLVQEFYYPLLSGMPCKTDSGFSLVRKN